MSLSGFSVVGHSIFLLHLHCIILHLIVSEQFSQVPPFLMESCAPFRLEAVCPSVTLSVGLLELLISLWCRTSDLMRAPGFFGCFALMAYAWINSYCDVINCYLYQALFYLEAVWIADLCCFIPKLPSVWVVLGNSWSQEYFLVTSVLKMFVETKVFSVLWWSFLYFLTGLYPFLWTYSEYDHGLGVVLHDRVTR